MQRPHRSAFSVSVIGLCCKENMNNGCEYAKHENELLTRLYASLELLETPQALLQLRN